MRDLNELIGIKINRRPWTEADCKRLQEIVDMVDRRYAERLFKQ